MTGQKQDCGESWWHMPVILTLRTLSHENCRCDASLGYTVNYGPAQTVR